MSEFRNKIESQMLDDEGISNMERDRGIIDDDRNMGWEIYDSGLFRFNEYFKSVIPDGYDSISDYIEDIYKDRKGELIGMELGGPGNNLFADFPKGMFKKTVGVCLNRPNHLDPDKIAKTHEILEANVFHKKIRPSQYFEGYQEVLKFVSKNGKVDFLIENMIGGAAGVDGELFFSYLKRWYKLLSDEGVMFIRFPAFGAITVGEDRLMKLFKFLINNADFFDFDISPMNFSYLNVPNLRLRKMPGAPESIDSLLKDGEVIK